MIFKRNRRLQGLPVGKKTKFDHKKFLEAMEKRGVPVTSKRREADKKE